MTDRFMVASTKLGAVQMSYDGLWGGGGGGGGVAKRYIIHKRMGYNVKILSYTGRGGQICREECHIMMIK